MSRQQITSHDGESIGVHITGSGPAVVFLPGWLGHPRDWRPVVQRLREEMTCHTLEPRPWLGVGDVSVAAMAGDLHALITAADLRDPLVVGHSMGAFVALEYLRRFGGDALGALCLVDQTPRMVTDGDWSLGPGGDFPAGANRRFIASLRDDFPGTAFRFLEQGRGESTHRDPRMATLFREARWQRVASLDGAPWIAAWEDFSWRDDRAIVAAIALPTLLVYGGAGPYGAPVAHWMQRTIPGARLELRDGIGHAPQHEDPVAFLEAIRGFALSRH